MTIYDYLKMNGPCLSGDLIRQLKNEGASDEAIRKRISRLKPPVHKKKGFFKDNQSFIFLDKQFETEEYYENLIIALKKAAKKYYSIIKAIEYHKGYIKKEHLASYTFSPILNLKTHKNYNNIISNLKDLNLITEEGNTYYVLSDKVSGNTNKNFNYYKGVEFAKNTILTQFYDYARKIGLISYNAGRFHSEFAKFQFNFVAPSYVTGITKYLSEAAKIQPAFILVDVLIGNKTEEEEILFFINKIDIIKSQSSSNFLPYLIVENISQSALKTLKEKGIIVGFINQLFGSEYQDLVKELINIITNSGAILNNNPQAFLKLLTQLNKLVDGKINNLKGDLFELVVGYYYSTISQRIDIGKKINFNNIDKEIDVVAYSQTLLVICECKAYKNMIDESTVKAWLSEKVPTIYKWAKAYNNNILIKFEFWSASGFTDEAKEYLLTQIKKAKKYSIDFIDERKIFDKAQELGIHKIKEIMREYFQ